MADFKFEIVEEITEEEQQTVVDTVIKCLQMTKK